MHHVKFAHHATKLRVSVHASSRLKKTLCKKGFTAQSTQRAPHTVHTVEPPSSGCLGIRGCPNSDLLTSQNTSDSEMCTQDCMLHLIIEMDLEVWTCLAGGYMGVKCRKLNMGVTLPIDFLIIEIKFDHFQQV